MAGANDPTSVTAEDDGVRIVSLLPSATEIVYALGLADDLAGITDECVHPRGTLDRHRVVVCAKQPHGLDAGEIDDWVTANATTGLYDLDDDAIALIRPDLVLTQDLCRVCAVPSGDVDAALDRLNCPATVLTLEPTSLDDVLSSIEDVARAAGVPERGHDVANDLRVRLARVADAVRGRPGVPTLVLEWLDPPYTAGHWVPDVVVAAGGIPLLATPGGRSGPCTWDEAAAAGAQVLVLAPCGIDPHLTAGRRNAVPAGLFAPTLLPARTYAADLACPGPRLVDCVEALAAVLHPDAGLTARPDVVVPVTVVG